MKFVAGFLTATSLIGLMYVGLFGGAYFTPSGLMRGALALWVVWLLVFSIRWFATRKSDDKVADWGGLMSFAAGILTATFLIGFMYAGLLGAYLTPNALWSYSVVLWLVWVVVWFIKKRTMGGSGTTKRTKQ